MLFADLVGFTSLAAARDPEEVRDLLSRYFDTSRDVVERYGGTIEKFIGDAVMAVWGAPVAQEDDAERAVRAALDLVEAVGRLGQANGIDLGLRAGVLTGEAAVTLGATGQGMVAGDLVNTASRLQSVAPPGTVLVGETTRRAAAAAITFEEAGEQTLKGKTAPVPAWRALRVVAERGGRGRSDTLEAPFVGRDDELRLLKDLYHSMAREGRARLVSVTGVAGIGKSRLAWEFLKYIDGLVEVVYWHSGRSPAFGEGVTFWSLGEMVRRRAGLAEHDDEATTRERIAATLAEFVPDEAERRRLEPALLFLLGIGDTPSTGRDELFGAWRTFFERIAENNPVILVFEDLQWADDGLLDFVDHLLDWSRNHAILVVTLARPELLDRRPAWGAGRRNFVGLSLEPLPEPAMRELLAGLVPGLPPAVARAILDRADGVPLYAVETVRMLVAEGRLVEADGAYRPTSDLADLAVPESLHALIAARLDALDAADRALLQDAAVLGQSFTLDSLLALTGQPVEALEPRLRDLVRRELLVLDSDPRSPERGQYGFTQALVREVAYATLAKRDRRSRHLAAARHFEALGDDASAGVLATHYLDAYQAAPEGPEGEAVAVQARIALRAAAERARALGSPDQAIAYIHKALDVATETSDEVELLEALGQAGWTAGRFEEAEHALRRAIELRRGQADAEGELRSTAMLGNILITANRIATAIEVLDPVESALLEPTPAAAAVWGQLARAYMFHEELDRAVEWADRALVAAERLSEPRLIADTLMTKGIAYSNIGRMREGTGLIELGRAVAEAEGLVELQMRAVINLAGLAASIQPKEAVEIAQSGLEVTRRVGSRHAGLILALNGAEAALQTGDLDWAKDALDDFMPVELDASDRFQLVATLTEVLAVRGEPTETLMQEVVSSPADDDLKQITAEVSRLWRSLAAGLLDDVVEAGMRVATISALNSPFALQASARAAVRARRPDNASIAIDRLMSSGIRGQALDAQRDVALAGIAVLEGRIDDGAAGYVDAMRRLRALGSDLDLGLACLEAVTVLPGGHPLRAASANEARELFARHGARPFLGQLDRVLAAEPLTAASTDRLDGGESRAATPASADSGS